MILEKGSIRRNPTALIRVKSKMFILSLILYMCASIMNDARMMIRSVISSNIFLFMISDKRVNIAAASEKNPITMFKRLFLRNDERGKKPFFEKENRYAIRYITDRKTMNLIIFDPILSHYDSFAFHKFTKFLSIFFSADN